MLGAFRVREEPLGDEEHQEFLDNLITQLMDEAGARYRQKDGSQHGISLTPMH